MGMKLIFFLFLGDICERSVDQCEDNPCQNGGTCLKTDTARQFYCDCGPSFIGDLCNVDVNECETQQGICQNGGTCKNTVGSYSCSCTLQFQGYNCERQVNLCTAGPCKNDAECRPTNNNGALGYECICKPGDRGRICDVSSRTFEPLSFVDYEITMGQRSNTIELEMSTQSSHALLSFVGSDSLTDFFMSLEIIDGYVKFSFLLGGTEPLSITVPIKVDTGEWFRVEATRNGRVCIFTDCFIFLLKYT